MLRVLGGTWLWQGETGAVSKRGSGIPTRLAKVKERVGPTGKMQAM